VPRLFDAVCSLVSCCSTRALDRYLARSGNGRASARIKTATPNARLRSLQTVNSTSALLLRIFRADVYQAQEVTTMLEFGNSLKRGRRWRRDYNQARGKQHLAGSPPAMLAAQWSETAASGPEAVSVRTGERAAGNSPEIST
jgi:hypothetical protein